VRVAGTMKLRLRIGAATHKVEVANACTLGELEAYLASTVTRGVRPVLGLNKTVRFMLLCPSRLRTSGARRSS